MLWRPVFFPNPTPRCTDFYSCRLSTTNDFDALPHSPPSSIITEKTHTQILKGIISQLLLRCFVPYLSKKEKRVVYTIISVSVVFFFFFFSCVWWISVYPHLSSMKGDVTRLYLPYCTSEWSLWHCLCQDPSRGSGDAYVVPVLVQVCQEWFRFKLVLCPWKTTMCHGGPWMEGCFSYSESRVYG